MLLFYFSCYVISKVLQLRGRIANKYLSRSVQIMREGALLEWSHRGSLSRLPLYQMGQLSILFNLNPDLCVLLCIDETTLLGFDFCNKNTFLPFFISRAFFYFLVVILLHLLNFWIKSTII